MKLRITLFIVLITNVLFSQNFHDTQGKLEISSSGQASYALPIAMPPSIKDVGPVINLVYASGQRGGIAGQGWNINSISAINRVSTRPDIDGFKDGVDFDANDKLSLDGQRLLVKSGTGDYWADNSQYQTAIQSNTKIELKGAGANIYFIVTSPDGSRSWYGNYNGMNATDATAYYIVRYEDPNGNFITYNYSKPKNKSLCINEIYFSANTVSNTTPLNKIVFNYDLATRNESAYTKGIKIEKVEILKSIEVFTNNSLFRRYALFHKTDVLGYQRVEKIEESNGAGELANPILFVYNDTPDTVVESVSEYTEIFNPNTNPELAGDFDGDGRADFIAKDKLYTKLFQGGGTVFTLPFSGASRLIFLATTLSNNKLNQKQSMVMADEKIDNVGFKVYNLESTGVTNSYTKTIAMNNSGTCQDVCVESYGCTEIDENGNTISVPCNNNCTSPTFIKNSNKYLEGDFNGDGISEVLVLSYIQTKTYGPPPVQKNSPTNLSVSTGKTEDPLPDDCIMILNTSELISQARLVDLNPNVSTSDNTAGNCLLQSAGLLNGKRSVMDFNSDGKADILVSYSNKTYRVLSFTQLPAAPWVEFEVIGEGTMDAYSDDKIMLFGDFNGDEKPDVMLPDADGNGCSGCNLWHIYYSNPNPAGGIYFVKESFNIAEYRQYTGTDYNTQWNATNYYAMDVNKDGKSDLVTAWTSLYQYSPFWDPKDIDSKWTVTSYINNIGLNNSFTLGYNSIVHDNDDNSRPIPITSSYKYKGLDSDLMIIRYHGNGSFDKTVTFIDFKKDFAQDNLLTKVTQSGGAIVDDIFYTGMEPEAGTNDLGTLSSFYSSSDELQYPFVEIKQNSSIKLVSQIKNTSLGTTKWQDFKYRGFSLQLNGLGLLGFKKTARSSWYSSASDKKTWSVTETNPLQVGITVRTYNQLPTTANFSFLTNYSTGLLSKTESSFLESAPGIFPYYILLNNQTSTDFLTNVISQKIYNSYSSDYFLPLSVTSNNYLGAALHGSSTTVTIYDPPVITGTGNGYYIGRPNEVNNTRTVYVNTLSGSPDIKTSNEKYFYTNGNLTSIEKKENGSAVTLVESFNYFPNGLLQSKTINATGTNSINQVSARSTSYTYDPTNRFISTTTDAEGLVTTNLTFNNYGLVLTHKNPYNQTTTSVYDNWGKRTKVTDFLNKSVTYNYSKANNLYTTIQTGDDGSGSIVVSDALARIIKNGNKDLNGNWVYSNIEYDYLGKKIRESQPYFSTATPTLWTSYEYDEYSRPIKTTGYTGKVINTKYTGLTIEVSDPVVGTKKTKTMNANGQVIIAEDAPGGTINYKYDANHNLLESNYDGIPIIITYDNWGRKETLNDTSAGTYSYTYNAYGETLTEVTPKGLTSYKLSPVGKISKKTVSGATTAENTSIISDYFYDSTNKWLTKIDVTNSFDGNSTYEYFYDTVGPTATLQLNKTIETLQYATFTKELSFDLFGRVETEKSTASAHSKSSIKTIKTTYKNGFPWQKLDAGTQQILWQTNTINERGQLISGYYGNDATVANSYNQYGYATQSKYDVFDETVVVNGELGAMVNLMTLNTTFDTQRGNLLNRTNSMFNWNENLEYDELDRLKKWGPTAPQELFNLDFSTSNVQGFVGVNGGTASVFLGKLKINTTASQSGVQKLIVNGVSSGTKFNVKVSVVKNTTDKIRVVAVEESVVTGVSTQIVLGLANDGLFQMDYQVQNNNSNIYIRFDKSENSADVGVLKTFTIDNLIISKYSIETQNYDDRGRITNNVLGAYQYTDNLKPYRNSSVYVTPEASAYYATRPIQNISYNTFKAPIQIEEQGIDKISFGYNALQQRSIMYYGSTDTDKLSRPYRKYYSADGSMEVKYTKAVGATPEKVEFITYVGGTAYDAPVVLKSDGTTQNYYYLHRDYQGSILVITDNIGGVVEKRLFDAWGAVLKVQDGVGNNLSKLTFFDRGYTGHEHLQSVGLINMNGRIYDPKLHRFLQPDNFVQDPYNTQNFNRYGYVLNNPFKYTDPTGEEGLLLAAGIGAAVALVSYLTMSWIEHTPLTFPGIASSTIIGAASGAITNGIGTAVQTITSSFWVNAGVQALAHGVFQGGIAAISGGKFWSGFAAGSISSIVSSAVGGGKFKLDDAGNPIAGSGFNGIMNGSKAGMIVFGTISGGAGAALTGGNFWKGAVTGLVVSGLNHAMHSVQENKYEKGAKEYIAIVVGESSDNATEAEAIGATIINRAALKGVEIKEGFLNLLGGKAQYNAIDGPDYNKIMSKSLTEIGGTLPGEAYYSRIKGAITSLYKAAAGVPLMTKSFFWNASYQQYNKNVGSNFKALNNGIFVKDTVLGASTFFSYANPNLHWP